MKSAEALVGKDVVARRLGITPALALDYARRRVLPSYRVGKYVRFAPQDIDAFLAARRRVPDTVPAVDQVPSPSLPQPRRRRFS